MTVYAIRGLTKTADSRTILNIPELTIESGRMYALLGPNGAGKTTLLNILGFLDHPSSGQLFYQDRAVRFTEAGLQPLRREVVMVDQYPILFSTTVYKNIEFGLKIRGIEAKQRQRIIEKSLELVDMHSFVNAPAHRLSGGETQRVALARGLVLSPKVFLCDEPTSSVDAENQATIMNILRHINEDLKMTVIFTTHDRIQAAGLTDHTLVLNNGKLVPTAYENIFSGRLVRQGQQSYRCRIRENITLALSPEIDVSHDKVRIFINPERITLGDIANMQGNQNQLRGKVIQITSENSLIRLVIDVGLNLSISLARADYEDIRPLVGCDTDIYIPPDAIRVVG